MNLGEFDLDPDALEDAQAPIRFERTPDELPAREGARAIVREALIPFVVWSDVPVRVLEPRRLGRMEVFLLESGIALGSFNLPELEDVTAVPARVIAASAAKLLRRGTFVEIESGEYAVIKDEAAEILGAKEVEEEHLRSIAFVYFPRQDLVIAGAEIAGQLLNVTRKLRAPRRAPFPDRFDRTVSVMDFLANRIAANRVLGFAHRLLGIGPWPKPPSWPDHSPCYYGRGYVNGAGDDAIADMQIWGYQRRRAAPRQYHGEKVKLTGAGPLIQEWVSLVDQFGSVFGGSARGLPAFSAERMEPFAPGQWRIGVSHEEANALAVGCWLTESVIISTCSPTAKVDVRVMFEPTDARAAERFALDSVAQRVDMRNLPHSDLDLVEYVRLARERYPLAVVAEVTRARVEERLWRMKRFVTVYQQRANEDFAYA